MAPRGRVNKQHKIYAMAYNEKQVNRTRLSEEMVTVLGRLEKA